MRFVVITSLFILINSCDTSTETKSRTVSSGYAILNQGSISSIDYYDLAKDSLISGIFQLNNNGETLSGYAEYIYQDEQFIYVTLQGDFLTGDGGRVLFLNRNFEQIYDLTDHPQNATTLYVGRYNQFLIVSYRHADANYNYSYILRKYEVTETTNSLSANQSGSDLNLSISGFAGGRFEIINDKLYAAAGKRIDVVDLSTFTITDSIFLAKPVVDATVNGEQLYAAIFNLSEIQNDSQDLVDGGFYLIENGALTDSLIGDYGYRKLLTVGERLFGIRWIGSGKSINPPYNFVSLNTEMVEINGKTETVLFSEPTMASVNDYWVHFQFDEIRERFLLPGSTDYVTSNFYIRDFSGALIKETSHPGQASNVIVLKEVQ